MTAGSKPSCSSGCCIVLTPAQVIMGCDSVCQSAHTRLPVPAPTPGCCHCPSLHRPLLLTAMWLLIRKKAYWSTCFPRSQRGTRATRRSSVWWRPNPRVPPAWKPWRVSQPGIGRQHAVVRGRRRLLGREKPQHEQYSNVRLQDSGDTEKGTLCRLSRTDTASKATRKRARAAVLIPGKRMALFSIPSMAFASNK